MTVHEIRPFVGQSLIVMGLLSACWIGAHLMLVSAGYPVQLTMVFMALAYGVFGTRMPSPGADPFLSWKVATWVAFNVVWFSTTVDAALQPFDVGLVRPVVGLVVFVAAWLVCAGAVGVRWTAHSDRQADEQARHEPDQ